MTVKILKIRWENGLKGVDLTGKGANHLLPLCISWKGCIPDSVRVYSYEGFDCPMGSRGKFALSTKRFQESYT